MTIYGHYENNVPTILINDWLPKRGWVRDGVFADYWNKGEYNHIHRTKAVEIEMKEEANVSFDEREKDLYDKIEQLETIVEEVEGLHNEQTGARNGDEWFEFKEFLAKIRHELVT